MPLKLKRAVYAGEQLFLDYGKEYWKDHGAATEAEEQAAPAPSTEEAAPPESETVGETAGETADRPAAWRTAAWLAVACCPPCKARPRVLSTQLRRFCTGVVGRGDCGGGSGLVEEQ